MLPPRTRQERRCEPRALFWLVGSLLPSGPLLGFWRKSENATTLLDGSAGAGAACLRRRPGEPGAARRPVQSRRDDPIPLATAGADRGPPGGEAARGRPGPAAARRRPGHVASPRLGGQRADVGGVRGSPCRARRGAGERADLVPDAQAVGLGAQKPSAPRSRTAPISSPPGRSGAPTWPRSTPAVWSSSTRAGPTPA